LLLGTLDMLILKPPPPGAKHAHPIGHIKWARIGRLPPGQERFFAPGLIPARRPRLDRFFPAERLRTAARQSTTASPRWAGNKSFL